ncbi:MAG TPA: TonB-dependent receptor plug domain-containing protein, partial [Puia sp.]
MFKALFVAIIGVLPLCALAQHQLFNIRCKPCTPDEVRDLLAYQSKQYFFLFNGDWAHQEIWMNERHANLQRILGIAFPDNYLLDSLVVPGKPIRYLITIRSQGKIGASHKKPEPFHADTSHTLQTAFVFFNGFEKVSLRNTPAVVSIVNSKELSQSLSMNPIKRALQFSTGVLSNALTGNPQGLSIWGRSSLLGNTAPNIIFGGLSWPGRLGDINPEDLERVTILKNSTAESLFGGTAASGVIVLEPKSGDYGRHFKINALINTTTTERPNILYQPRLSTARFVDAERHFSDLGYYDDFFNDPKHPISKAVETFRLMRENKLSSTDAGIILAALERNDLLKEVQNKFFQESVSTQYHVGIDAARPNYHSYTGLSYSNDPTALTRNGNHQYSVYTNHTFRSFSKKLETNLAFNYTHFDQLLNNPGTIDVSTPYDRLEDEKGNALAVTYNLNDHYVDNLGSPYLDWHYRPLDELRLADNKYMHRNVFGQLGLSYGIRDWLHIEALGRVSDDRSTQTIYYGPGTFRVRDSVNSVRASKDPAYSLDQGYGLQYDTIGKTYTGRLLARYKRKD